MPDSTTLQHLIYWEEQTHLAAMLQPVPDSSLTVAVLSLPNTAEVDPRL